MLPVSDGKGENAAGALNALVPVPASGGGRRPCVRGLPIHTSLFPYSTVAGARALVDSQDALSVFVATVIEDRAYNWASSWRSRLSYGCSRYVHQLGYPLLISQVGAAPAGAAPRPLTGQGSALGSRAPKCRRLLQVVDNDDEEEEAAPTLVHRPRSRPDVAPADGGRTAEDPPTAHVEQACPRKAKVATTARRARRTVFTASHRSSNL